jgi:hypothetical protein
MGPQPSASLLVRQMRVHAFTGSADRKQLRAAALAILERGGLTPVDAATLHIIVAQTYRSKHMAAISSYLDALEIANANKLTTVEVEIKLALYALYKDIGEDKKARILADELLRQGLNALLDLGSSAADELQGVLDEIIATAGDVVAGVRGGVRRLFAQPSDKADTNGDEKGVKN